MQSSSMYNLKFLYPFLVYFSHLTYFLPSHNWNAVCFQSLIFCPSSIMVSRTDLPYGLNLFWVAEIFICTLPLTDHHLTWSLPHILVVTADITTLPDNKHTYYNYRVKQYHDTELQRLGDSSQFAIPYKCS
jgi:branched-subunit amino acid permease